MKYKLIYADCPWQFTNKKTGGSMKSGADAQYPTMTIDQLKNMDIESITDKDCVLVMWWVGSMTQEAIDLVNAWGFTIKNMNGFVWNKLTKLHKPFFGMGFYTRAGSESAIIATKGEGAKLIQDHSVRAVGSYPVAAHSAKPHGFRERCVQLVGDVPRLEMFARKRYSGWDRFGNEVRGSIKIPTRFTHGRSYILEFTTFNNIDFDIICKFDGLRDVFEEVHSGICHTVELLESLNAKITEVK